MKAIRLRHRGFIALSLGLQIVLVLTLAGCMAPIYVQQAQQLAQTFSTGRLNRPAESIPALSTEAPTFVSPTNRLLVQGADGNIYTIDPDGNNALALTNDATAERLYTQPTWSPLGEEIAWSRIDVVGDRPRATVVTSLYDGSATNGLEVAYPPFYLYWSPTGEQLAYLSTWVDAGQQSMALRLVDLSGENYEATTLALGAPFYFSWSPDGTQMITHIGSDRLELQPLDADASSVDALPGLFPAPQWLGDGESVVYAILDEDGEKQQLIRSNLVDEKQLKVVDFEGRISFTANPVGNQLAYVLTSPFAQMSALGTLYVADLETGGIREVSDGQVVGFFWSPDGSKLAYMQLEEVEKELGIRWYVWDGKQRTQYEFFMPTSTFLNSYLPYFDQYSRSMTLWSPDSSAFTYAGMHSDRIAGVWVQEVKEGARPFYVANGVHASWSPR